MEKYFKKDILDEIYDAKKDDFCKKISDEILKKNGKIKSLTAEEKLKNKIREVVEDEVKRKEIMKLLNEYEIESGSELYLWNKIHYKLGVYDCINMKEILQKKFSNEGKEEKSSAFIDKYSDDFEDYLETEKRTLLKENEEYQKLLKKISQIKAKNPNVRTVIEDKEAVNLSDVELNEILNIIEIQEKVNEIELKQCFKLGIREMLLFIKQMNLL